MTAYRYNTSGIRISAQTTVTDGTAAVIEDTATNYLIDPSNPTGYAQVLEEATYNIIDPTGPVLAETICYTLGDDVISQNSSVSGLRYLLYDGHGSTRQLVDVSGDVAIDAQSGREQSYSYDSYGVMLSDGSGAEAAASAQTSLLYTGEQYDSGLDQYYLRARYYNQNNGTFNRMDDFAGNMQDPQSLHKYTYVHNNPVNGIDPSGMFSIGEINITSAIRSSLQNIGGYLNTISKIKRTVDYVSTALEMFKMFQSGGLTLIYQEILKGIKSWGSIGKACTTSRLLDPQIYADAAEVLLRNAIFIVWQSLSKKINITSITNMFKDSRNGWIVYLPTPTGDTLIDKMIPIFPLPLIKLPSNFTIAERPVYLKFGESPKRRGRFLGLGVIENYNTQQSAQLFRMDYHNSHGAKDEVRRDSGLKYTFHFHVRM